MTEITMEIELQPFQTPNFVIAKVAPRPRQDGLVEAPKWPLKEIDPLVLSEMCDEFRADIFRKSGQPDPRTTGVADGPSQEQG